MHLGEEHVRQVIMAAHDLPHPAPHLRILVVEALDVGDGREVGRVEGGEARGEARALCVVEGEPRVCDHLVGVGVPATCRQGR